jgi:N-acetyl-gamma-glutamyl-phosphate reductase/acetylglutamate kinase
MLRGKKTNVAYYNRGHSLAGWNYEAAECLLNEREQEFSTASVTSSKWATEDSPGNSSSQKVYKVALLGARGYVGREFVNLLCDHPHMELKIASSRALAGQRVQECFSIERKKSLDGVNDLVFRELEPNDLLRDPVSQEVDVWVLALPNGLAPKFVATLDEIAAFRGKEKTVIIDLSADYRFDDAWVYGLPEHPGNRSLLRSATRISNPGCYATGAQTALMPLLQPADSSCKLRIEPGSIPAIFGVSGYSGAGTNPSPKNDPKVLINNIVPYSLVNHIHEKECSHHLDHRIAFMPHVASWFRGIHLTTSVHLRDFDGIDDSSLLSLYEKYYEGEALVKVSASAPTVRQNANKHHVAVGGFTVDPQTGRAVIISTIDNLLKGAATQAIQNLNISLNLDEYCGLKTT